MKMLRVPLLVMGLLMCAQGFAATEQQNKMTTCNADATAKSLKGDERKDVHEHLPESRSCNDRHPSAGKDEDLQRHGQHAGAQGRRAQDVHERLPEEKVRLLFSCKAVAGPQFVLGRTFSTTACRGLRSP
jgi:hypothetical protein